MKQSLIAAFLVVTMHVCRASAATPNIIMIMADDLGLGDVSHHVRTVERRESVLETPAIDSLATDGIWFTDGHASTALSSPTRYCVMSGNLNFRSHAPWGVWETFRKNAVKPGQATLGTVARLGTKEVRGIRSQPRRLPTPRLLDAGMDSY